MSLVLHKNSIWKIKQDTIREYYPIYIKTINSCKFYNFPVVGDINDNIHLNAVDYNATWLYPVGYFTSYVIFQTSNGGDQNFHFDQNSGSDSIEYVGSQPSLYRINVISQV